MSVRSGWTSATLVGHTSTKRKRVSTFVQTHSLALRARMLGDRRQSGAVQLARLFDFGPLSLWERVRVRVFAESVLPKSPYPGPLPKGEGAKNGILTEVKQSN